VPYEVHGPEQPRSKPGGKPGGGGSGGGSATVTGAAWTQGGSVVATTGKVFFRSGKTLYTCSGSLVDSAFGSLVVTAGHCVHDGNGGAFHTEWMFLPGYPDQTLGEWTAHSLFTTPGWADHGSFTDDFGLAAVDGPGGASLETAVGTATVPTIAFDQPADVTYTSFGYPAAKKYSGQVLVHCQGPVSATSIRARSPWRVT
jgi:V8-like Glu-specific endopeptidase